MGGRHGRPMRSVGLTFFFTAGSVNSVRLAELKQFQRTARGRVYMSAKGTVICPGCSTNLQLPTGFTTGKIKCPACGKSLALKMPQAPVAPQVMPSESNSASPFADLTALGPPSAAGQPAVGLPPAQPTSVLGAAQHQHGVGARARTNSHSAGVTPFKLALISGGVVAALAVVGCVGFFMLRSQPTAISTSDSATSFDFDETKKAADSGDSDAQNKLGFMYDQGKGVPQDYAEAVKWYRLSAEQGDASAQYNLALMYDRGDGVSSDPFEAAKWHRLAAGQGYADSQLLLGCMYVDGKGVPKDNSEAYIWLSIAAYFYKDINTDKYTDAVSLRDKAASRLTPEERSKAKIRGGAMVEEILLSSVQDGEK